MFDKAQNAYVPTISGLGMHVEIRDPDDQIILARVSNCLCAAVEFIFLYVFVALFCDC